jgi:hypothetical protein
MEGSGEWKWEIKRCHRHGVLETPFLVFPNLSFGFMQAKG